MFNVIKGGFVNKDAKPIVIKPKRKNITSNDSSEDSSLEKQLYQEDNSEKKNNFNPTQETLNHNQNKVKDEDAFKGFEIDEEILAKREEREELVKEIEHLKLKSAQDAKNIIEDARLRAEIEVNEIKGEAWDVGYREGIEAGKKQVLLNSSNIFSNVQSVMEEALKQKDMILDETKSEIMAMIFRIAKKVIKSELKNEEVLKNNLTEAFNYISTSKKITVYVNWSQLELAQELRDELKSKFYAIEEFNIVEDKNLLPGGCIIETQMGRIDASIETQIDSILEGLKD